MFAQFKNQLDQRNADNLFRSRRKLQSANKKLIRIDDKPVINFSSNNYLGLADHIAIKNAFDECTKHYGMGSGASQFMSGYNHPVSMLEQELAAFFKRDRAIVFSSGYLANLAAVTAIANRNSTIIADKFSHASLIDAAILSQARFKRYLHTDPTSLAMNLSKCNETNKLIITEGVFSMDGDMAPLPEIITASKKYRAIVLVDDAHGIGVLGKKSGAGIVEHYSIDQIQVPILVGTFGKAFGLSGAFVAGPDPLIETILQFGRSAIYTTAIMPALAASASAALNLIETESWRREKLSELIQIFKHESEKADFNLLPSNTPIQPLIIGSNDRAVKISNGLFEAGYYAPAIRTPTVPKGTARLRITITAGHEAKDIKSLVGSLNTLFK